MTLSEGWPLVRGVSNTIIDGLFSEMACGGGGHVKEALLGYQTAHRFCMKGSPRQKMHL